MRTGLVLSGVTAALSVVASAPAYNRVDFDYGFDEDSSLPRNVIMMIPDGTSPNVFTMARTLLDPTLEFRLHVDDILSGTVKTYSNNSLITDSASSATAYATGFKTYNGAISVDTDKRPLGTILEAAADRGMATGMIATSRVTHATPACFASHVDSRSKEDEIADQYIKNMQLDYLFGGGKRHFSKEHFALLQANGYASVKNALELKELPDSTTKAYGLFSKSHMAYEIDRHSTEQPSLTEMTKKLLTLMENNPKAQKHGFFIMIEGSRIDHAGHENDPAPMARDAIEFDRAIGVAKEYVGHHKNTALISAADHGTGGIGIGIKNIYAWKPEVLANVTMSTDVMSKILKQLRKETKGEAKEVAKVLTKKVQELLKEHADVAWEEVAEERKALLQERMKYYLENGEGLNEMREVIAHMISDKAMIGWTTSGHVAGDVNLHCYGPYRFERMCRGNHENTRVNTIMRDYLNLNQQAQTLRLRYP